MCLSTSNVDLPPSLPLSVLCFSLHFCCPTVVAWKNLEYTSQYTRKTFKSAWTTDVKTTIFPIGQSIGDQVAAATLQTDHSLESYYTAFTFVSGHSILQK